MPRIDDTNITIVLDQYLPERERLIELLDTQPGITAPPVTSTVYSWGDNMYGAVGTGALGVSFRE